MARNQPNTPEGKATETVDAVANQAMAGGPQMAAAASTPNTPGGAAGVMPRAAAMGGMTTTAPTASAVRPNVPPAEGEAAVPARRFRVVNGGFVTYANCRTAIRAGKIVTDREFDLDHLRRQGVVLVELPAEVTQ